MKRGIRWTDRLQILADLWGMTPAQLSQIAHHFGCLCQEGEIVRTRLLMESIATACCLSDEFLKKSLHETYVVDVKLQGGANKQKKLKGVDERHREGLDAYLAGVFG